MKNLSVFIVLILLSQIAFSQVTGGGGSEANPKASVAAPVKTSSIGIHLGRFGGLALDFEFCPSDIGVAWGIGAFGTSLEVRKHFAKNIQSPSVGMAIGFNWMHFLSDDGMVMGFEEGSLFFMPTYEYRTKGGFTVGIGAGIGFWDEFEEVTPALRFGVGFSFGR